MVFQYRLAGSGHAEGATYAEVAHQEQAAIRPQLAEASKQVRCCRPALHGYCAPPAAWTLCACRS